MTTVSVVSMTKGCYKNYYAFRAYGKTSACKWHNSYRARGPLVTRLKEPHPAFCSSTFHVRRLRKIQYFVTRKLFDQRGYIILYAILAAHASSGCESTALQITARRQNKKKEKTTRARQSKKNKKKTSKEDLGNSRGRKKS